MASQEVSTDMMNLDVGSSPVAALLGAMMNVIWKVDEWKLLMLQENCKRYGVLLRCTWVC